MFICWPMFIHSDLNGLLLNLILSCKVETSRQRGGGSQCCLSEVFFFNPLAFCRGGEGELNPAAALNYSEGCRSSLTRGQVLRLAHLPPGLASSSRTFMGTVIIIPTRRRGNQSLLTCSTVISTVIFSVGTVAPRRSQLAHGALSRDPRDQCAAGLWIWMLNN